MSLSTDNMRVERASEAHRSGVTPTLDYASMPPLFVVADVVLILGLSVLVDFLFSAQASGGFEVTQPIGIGILAAVAFVLTTISRGLYKPWRMVRVVEEVRATMVSWTFAILVVATVIFCLKVAEARRASRPGLLPFSALSRFRCRVGRWVSGCAGPSRAAP